MDEGQRSDRKTLGFCSAATVVEESPLGMSTHYLRRDSTGTPVDHVFLEMNRAYQVLTGLTRRRCIGRRGSAVMPAPAVRALAELFGRAVDQRCTVEFEFDVPDSARRLRITAFPTGREAVGTIVSDITATKQAESLTRACADALEQTGELVLLTDASGRIEYVNRGLLEFRGADHAAVLGRELQDLMPALWHRIRGCERWSGSAPVRDRVDAEWLVSWLASANRAADGQLTHHVVVGRPAIPIVAPAAAAFDRTRVSLDGLQMPADGSFESEADLDRALLLAQHLRQLKREATRAMAQHRDWVAAQAASATARPIKLNDVLAGLGDRLRAVLGGEIALALACGEDVGRVAVDPRQLEPVLRQLAVAARAANGGRRTIELTTSTFTAEPDGGSRSELEPGQYVQLTWADAAGCSAPGWAAAHELWTHHSSQLTITSEPGDGMRVSVFVPVTDAPRMGRDGPERQPMESTRERILVVEDDESILRLTVRLLESVGYEVIPATGSREALALLDEPDLVLADLTLDDGDGLVVAQALKQRWPELRMLCVSGYPIESLSESHSALDQSHFLTKPYSAGQLRAKIRAVLDG